MNYIGKLYGKFAGKYIPLEMDSVQVETLEAENKRLREVLNWYADIFNHGDATVAYRAEKALKGGE